MRRRVADCGGELVACGENPESETERGEKQTRSWEQDDQARAGGPLEVLGMGEPSACRSPRCVECAGGQILFLREPKAHGLDLRSSRDSSAAGRRGG
jgi:hypothetical protein